LLLIFLLACSSTSEMKGSVYFAANRRGTYSVLHDATNLKGIMVLITPAHRAVIWFECSIDVLLFVPRYVTVVKL
jgi:hypothetical protein